MGSVDMTEPISPRQFHGADGVEDWRVVRDHQDRGDSPEDQAEARIAAALAAGGRLISDANAPAWWTLADAEGNEACVATWAGREE